MTNKLKQAAWYIVIETINEASDRYNLRLFGSVVENHGDFTLYLFDPSSLMEASQKISFEFLEDTYSIRAFIQTAMIPIIRKYAEDRDIRRTTNDGYK